MRREMRNKIMYDIERYIEKANEMINTSTGGSPCYDFGDVVLVKYEEGRDKERLIAQAANEKRADGVNTPYHLAFKKEKNVCYVLQEKAKGYPLTKFSYPKTEEELMTNAKILAEAPSSHYIKLIKDLGELMHMGLEIKPKNIFYEPSENGGFTIIDLLGFDTRKMKNNSLEDILFVLDSAFYIPKGLPIEVYHGETSEQIKKQILELNYKIRKRIFAALEGSIPNFEIYRRWILRTLDDKTLSYFNQDIENLTLNQEEVTMFDTMIDTIISKVLLHEKKGRIEPETTMWLIESKMRRNGLEKSWNYHPENPYALSSTDNFQEKYRIQWASSTCLKEYVANHILQIQEKESEVLKSEKQSQKIKAA